MWRQTRIAIEFFQQQLPFTQMQSADECVQPSGTFCFAKPGEVYAIQYRSGTEQTKLWLPEPRYSISWFDPRRGGKLQSGSVTSITGTGDYTALGSPPHEGSRDWIALVTLDGPAAKIVTPPCGR